MKAKSIHRTTILKRGVLALVLALFAGFAFAGRAAAGKEVQLVSGVDPGKSKVLRLKFSKSVRRLLTSTPAASKVAVSARVRDGAGNVRTVSKAMKITIAGAKRR